MCWVKKPRVSSRSRHMFAVWAGAVLKLRRVSTSQVGLSALAALFSLKYRNCPLVALS